MTIRMPFRSEAGVEFREVEAVRTFELFGQQWAVHRKYGTQYAVSHVETGFMVPDCVANLPDLSLVFAQGYLTAKGRDKVLASIRKARETLGALR